jgi:hypothetical protein
MHKYTQKKEKPFLFFENKFFFKMSQIRLLPCLYFLLQIYRILAPPTVYMLIILSSVSV